MRRVPLPPAPRRRRGIGAEGEVWPQRRQRQVRAAVRRAALHRDARDGAPLSGREAG